MPLIQPVSLFQLFRKVLLGEILKVLVGQRVELVLEAAREHPLDLFLPALFLKPGISEKLFRPGDVFFIQLDADVAREAVGFGVAAGEADELRLRDRLRWLSKARLIEPCFTTE